MPVYPEVLVVGMHFRGAEAKAVAENLIPPVDLDLEREPENPYDENAIKVLYQGMHIGYIERGQAAFIAPKMDEGEAYGCTVTELVQRGRNIHPQVDIYPLDEETDDDYDLY